MTGVFVLATLGPVVLILALGKTRAWWVPGAALVASTFVCFSSIEHTESGSPLGGLEGIGNFILTAAGIWCACYAVAAFAIAARMRTKAKAAAAALPALPTATVVISERS
jgi:hypothetical protein